VEPKGELIESFEEVENQWVPYSDLAGLDKLFPDVLETVELMREEKMQFREQTFVIEDF